MKDGRSPARLLNETALPKPARGESARAARALMRAMTCNRYVAVRPESPDSRRRYADHLRPQATAWNGTG